MFQRDTYPVSIVAPTGEQYMTCTTDRLNHFYQLMLYADQSSSLLNPLSDKLYGILQTATLKELSGM